MRSYLSLCSNALSLWWVDSFLIVLALQQAPVGARTASSSEIMLLGKTATTGFAAPLRVDGSSISISTYKAQAMEARALQQATRFFGRTLPWRGARSTSKMVVHSKRGGIFTCGIQQSQPDFVTRFRSSRRHSTLTAEAAVEPSRSDALAIGHAALQHVCDELVTGGSLADVEDTLAKVEGYMFSQAEAWKRSWAPMRSTIAQIPDSWAISVLVIPRECACNYS